MRGIILALNEPIVFTVFSFFYGSSKDEIYELEKRQAYDAHKLSFYYIIQRQRRSVRH